MEALNNTSAACTGAWKIISLNHTTTAPFAEDPNYLSEQLITYIGNKRALLGQIGKAVMYVKKRTGKEHLRVFDAFSGSGVVSRFLKAHASLIVSNDFEDYAAVVARCYLRNRGSVNFTSSVRNCRRIKRSRG